MFLIFVLVIAPHMSKRDRIQAPLVLDAPIIREAHCVAQPSRHREFFHISPVLITSSTTKRGGVSKYIDTNSAGNAKNHNQRPADLWGEVINDAKPGMPYNWLAGLR